MRTWEHRTVIFIRMTCANLDTENEDERAQGDMEAPAEWSWDTEQGSRERSVRWRGDNAGSESLSGELNMGLRCCKNLMRVSKAKITRIWGQKKSLNKRRQGNSSVMKVTLAHVHLPIMYSQTSLAQTSHQAGVEHLPPTTLRVMAQEVHSGHPDAMNRLVYLRLDFFLTAPNAL